MIRTFLVVFWLMALMVALAMPSPASRFFDGLPWISGPELLSLAAALGVLLSTSARDRLAGWCLRGRLAARATLWLIPPTLFVLKLAAGSLEPAGFAACYGHLVAGRDPVPCERSFDASFAPSTVTRYDRTIDFSRRWRLGFINSSRFNFYRAGQYDRERLPFRAAWTGAVELNEGDTIEIEYVGAGTVVAGQSRIALDTVTKPTAKSMTVNAGRQRFAASYQFDDGSRVGSKPDSDPPFFRIAVIDSAGEARLLSPGGSSTAGTLLVATLDGIASAGVIVLFMALTMTLRLLLPVALGLIWAWVAFGIDFTPMTAFYVLAAGSAAAAMIPQIAAPSVLLPFAAAVGGMLTRSRLSSVDALIVRTGGNDWLTYESQARTILETWSLQGGEAIFYYQPFYRYAKFLLRLFLGESDFHVHVAMNTALFGGVLMFVWLVARRLTSGWRPMVAAGGAAALMVLSSNWAQSIALRGLSEPVGWALYPMAFGLLFAVEQRRAHLVGMLLIGLCAFTRLNHLPAVGVIAGAYYLYHQPRSWSGRLLPAAVLGAVLLLPLAHNLYYGDAFVLTTRSIAIPQNLELRPAQLLQWPLDPDVSDAVRLRLSELVFLQAGWFGVDELQLGLRLCQALWLIAIPLALWRRTWFHTAIVVLPVAFLAVHILYQISYYYPRHLIAGHLAMALAPALMALPSPFAPIGRGRA